MHVVNLKINDEDTFCDLLFLFKIKGTRHPIKRFHTL